MIFGITCNNHPPPTGFDFVALGNALHRIVCALDMKIRMDFANERAHIFFWEDHHGVHIRQCRQNFRAFFRGRYRPPFTLQGAHGSIAVHRDNQFAAEFPRGMQVTYVADVQHIETSIGQRDAIASAPPIRDTYLKFIARKNLLMR